MNFVWMLALLVVSYIISAALTPRPKSTPDAIATMFKDINFPVADEGTPQAVLFGDCWTPDFQVLWYGNMRTDPIKTSTSSGKK